MEHHNNLNDFNALIAQLELEIAASAKQGRFDLHKISESFFCGVLKELYGWRHLRNANKRRINYPGVDLVDDEQGIAVQVTSDPSHRKIVDAISKFVAHEQHERYSRLIVLGLGSKQRRYNERAMLEACRERISFLVDRDVLDFPSLCQDAASCAPEQLAAAVRIARAHFKQESASDSGTRTLRATTTAAFATHHLAVNGRNIVARDRSVSLEIAAPCSDDISMKSVLRLARGELNGVEFRIDSGQLVRWLVWRLHTDLQQDRPYAPRIPGDQKSFALSTGGARLELAENEVQNLDWVLRAAAGPLLEAARDLCNLWRVHRFDRVEERDAGVDFAIVLMNQQQWRSVLQFARSHDFDRGDSPWHCFDGSGECLKVLGRGGIRLICDAFSWSARVADSNLVRVTWTAPTGGDSLRMWDAETAHEWLVHELLPAVHQCEDREWSRRWQDYSLAKYDLPTALVPAFDIGTLVGALARLQDYFNLPLMDSPPPRYVRPILRVAHRLASMHTDVDEQYVRGNFALHDDEPIAQGLSRRLAEPAYFPRRFQVDLALRGLLSLAKTLKHAERGLLEFAASELQPVWGFYQDHLVLRHWTGSSESLVDGW